MSFTYTLRTLRQSFRSRRPVTTARQSTRPLQLEGLEERLSPVIGSLAIPTPVAPGTGFDGVVQLSQGCTGSLLSSGRHILTAAHCVTDGAGTINVANSGVIFQLPGKTITINVPQANYWVHPGWNGSATTGNDVAVLRLPVLAPSGPVGVGAERYPLQFTTDEVNDTFRVVGYGRTGTGVTGNANGGGVKRSGQNIWTTTGSTLRNEVQAVSRTGAPTGGTFRLTFSGQTTANIPYNATAAQVQAALAALANLAAGDINVEGGPALNTPWFVSFRGARANSNVPQMTFTDNIVGGSLSIATRYQGATEAPLSGALAYDFDNGNTRNDALGLMYGLPGLGVGASEASQSQGDSGGPAFIGNRISGIVSYSLGLNPGSPPDIDGVANNSFGELGVMTRVSSFTGAITAQTNLAYQLVVDMAFQHAGNNGGADTIQVTRFGNVLLLSVNGNLIHSDALTDITSVVIRGSNDRDVITVGGDLGELVTVQGNGGIDELIVTGTAGNDLTTVSSNQVQLGATTINYSTVELVRLNLLDGNDTVNILSTGASTPVLADAGAGNDTITIGSVANSLAAILGNVTVLGGPDGISDLLYLDDQGNAAARAFTVTNNSVTWVGGPTITYGTIEGLTLNAGTGNDVVNILSTTAATPVGVSGGAGNDTVILGSVANSLAAILGNVSFFGGPDTTQDVLTLDDQGNAVARTFTVTSNSVSWIGGPTIFYITVERLNLNAGTGNDLVNILSTAAATPVTVNGGAGNDTFTLGSVANVLSAILSNVTVLGGTDTTQDVLNLDDQGYAAVRTFTVTNNSVSWTGGPTISYATVERLTLNAGTNNDAVNVLSTAAATPVTVNAGAGNDTVHVGNAANSLNSLGGPLTVNGQGGSDTLNVNDQAAPAAQDLFLTSNTVRRTGTQTVTYATVETLNLVASSGGDTGFNVASTAVGMTINLIGAGADYLILTAGSSTFAVTAFNAGTLTGLGLGSEVTWSGVGNLIGGAGDDRFAFADGQSISGYLDGLGGTNTLDFTAWTTGVYVDLNNWVATTASAVFSMVNVLGGSGDDYVHGDGLSNVLVGNAGHDILVGDEGNDTVLGGDGADQLYGGGGADSLLGGLGEDLLIDGYTSYDYDVTALSEIWLEWTRMDGTDYYTRIENLRNGTGLCTYLLDANNVFTDGDADEVYGQDDLDWFWATEGYDFTDRVDPDEIAN